MEIRCKLKACLRCVRDAERVHGAFETGFVINAQHLRQVSGPLS
jgi:hypothetical protein